jgi:TPR repeat protein
MRFGPVLLILLLVGLAIALICQTWSYRQLAAENRALRQQLDQLGTLATENSRLSNQLADAQTAHEIDNQQLDDLLRLRNEVGQLRKRTQEVEAQHKATTPATAEPVTLSRQEFLRGNSAWRMGDFGDAMRILLPLAQQGDASAQHRVGVMHAFGQGVPQDWKEATRWFQKSADQGLAASQFSMGLRYLEGQGVNGNSEAAAAWLRASADQGTGMAASVLATLYAKGDGVPQDMEEAYKWLTIAGDQIEPRHVSVTLNSLRAQLTPE